MSDCLRVCVRLCLCLCVCLSVCARAFCVCVCVCVLLSSEQLQRGHPERGGTGGRHERGRALRRQGGHLRGTQDVRRQRRLRGALQGTGGGLFTAQRFISDVFFPLTLYALETWVLCVYDARQRT